VLLMLLIHETAPTDIYTLSLHDALPIYHLRVGIETAARNIERAVNKALVTADVASREIVWAYCGIAGADHPAHRQEIVDSLNIFFPRGNFTVDNDARIALTGAIGFGAGVVVIAGTGSVAFGRNDAGEEARAGGWGPTLGDEGSAYGIARAGLAAVLRAYDGRAFNAGELLVGPMKQTVTARVPRAKIGPPQRTPVEGAAMMAIRAAAAPRPSRSRA